MPESRWGMQQADDSLAKRFSWQMNACTWKYGVLSDLIYASVLAGLFVVIAAFFSRHGFFAVATVCIWLAVACVVFAFAANIYLRNARSRVVAWMANMPFALENVNAILAGGGESFELHFADAVPSRDRVMSNLEAVSDDVFVLSVDEEQRMVLARFGVIGSKHAPIQTARRRYVRMQDIVERAVVPLHEQFPIRMVRFVA